MVKYVYITKKVCNKCKTEKLLTDFYNNKKTIDGRATYCKDCTKAIRKQWYENNKDYYQAYQKQYPRTPEKTYRKTHPEQWMAYIDQYIKVYRADPMNKFKQQLSLLLSELKQTKKIVPSSSCSICGSSDKKIYAHYPEDKIEQQFIINQTRINNEYFKNINTEFIFNNLSWICSTCKTNKRTDKIKNKK